MRYMLELSNEQAEIIKIALEEYFRLRMNQTWDFADDLCFEAFNYECYKPEDFDNRIENRNTFQEELRELLERFHPLYVNGMGLRKQTIEMRRAHDIWQVIRQRLYLDRGGDPNGWCVDSREPMPMTDEPLPKMERVEECLAQSNR